MKNKNSFINWLKNPSSDIWLFIIALVLLNLVIARAFFRFDLTDSRSYSLSKASKNVVKTIEEPLSVKVFFSDSLPAPYSSVSQYVKDILSEYKMAANKNFSFEYFDMDKIENQNIARDYGLQQVQIREIKNNEVGFKNVYMGLVFTYADQIETLDELVTTDGLEYKITKTVCDIISATNALAGLSENVKLTLYKSNSLKDFNISGFNEIDSVVSNAYEAVNKKYKGRISYESIDSSLLSTEELELLSNKYGIQAFSWQDESGVSKYGALGLVVELGDKFKVVPLEMVNIIFGYAIQGLDTLQTSLTESIQALVSKTSVIAYVTNHGELNIEDYQMGAANFASLVSDNYEFEPLDLQKSNIPSGVQSIVINGPKQEFTQEELYKIDQFLLKGGNVMLFLDPFNVIEPQGELAYYQAPEYVLNKTGLETLLEKYGATQDACYVFDEQCYSTLNQQYGKLDFYYAPVLQKEQLNKTNAITKNLGFVLFLQPGSIDVSVAQNNPDLNVTVLAKSSKKSWTQKENFNLSPLAISVPQDTSVQKPYNLCVLLEGKFKSAFENSPVKNDSNMQQEVFISNHVKESVQKGKLFVSSTSYITSPQVLQEQSEEPIALFLQNAVDYLNGNEDFCAMRTKGLSLNALAITQGSFVNAVKIFNSFGLAVIVAFVGLLVYLSRRRHRTEIKMLYDPNDSRENIPHKNKSEAGDTK